jgi:hypothetical protein
MSMVMSLRWKSIGGGAGSVGGVAWVVVVQPWNGAMEGNLKQSKAE